MASSCSRRCLDKILLFYLLLLSHGKSCKVLEEAVQRNGRVIIPGCVKKNVWMWPLRTQLSGEHGDGAGLMSVLDDLKNLFQPLIVP